MTTQLDKTLKRELPIRGTLFVLTLSPDGLKLTLKGRRKGMELRWEDLVNGEAALAVALQASVGKFTDEPKLALKSDGQRKAGSGTTSKTRRSTRRRIR